jgi:NAD(P)-dependent dehydrogenase (short-subunit alcohol dehydrogenase family)
MRELEGKVAIVTGSSRGIGAGIARALGQAGVAVMVTGRDAAQAAETAAGIVASGGRAEATACDVADYAQVERLVAQTRERLGPIDILVNNAGIIEPIGPLIDSEPAAWARNILVNIVGGYHAVRAVVPEMLAAGRGIVVNVSSGAAHRPLEGWGAYATGKAGIAMAMRALALETAGRGLRVHGLSPGSVDTDMQGLIRASGLNPVSRIPRQALAPVEHPARAVVYLCSDAAADLAGSEVSLGDPDFRRRIGLA